MRPLQQPLSGRTQGFARHSRLLGATRVRDALPRPLPLSVPPPSFPAWCAYSRFPSAATVAELSSPGQRLLEERRPPSAFPQAPAPLNRRRAPDRRLWRANPRGFRKRMATSGVEKSSKKKTEKKLAAREEAKLLAGFMGVMNNMRKQVRAVRGRGAGPGRAAGPVALAAGLSPWLRAYSATGLPRPTQRGQRRRAVGLKGRCVTGLLRFSEAGSLAFAGGCGAVRSEALPPVSPRSHSLTNPLIPSNLENRYR